MEHEAPQSILAFIQAAENLKNTLRYAYTSTGRRESAAEHSWRLCLLILVCSRPLGAVNVEKLLKLAVVHDLAEAVCGDTPAISRPQAESKSLRERQSLTALCAPLPEDAAREILDLWEEYEAAATDEARIVKGLDKLETLIQHNQGRNPADFDYAFNLAYGREHTDALPALHALRDLIDRDTAARLQTAGRETTGHDEPAVE